MNDLTHQEQPLLLCVRQRSFRPASGPAGKASLRDSRPPDCLVLEINPEDAGRLDVKDGQTVAATAQSATIRAMARVNPEITPGTALLVAPDVFPDSRPPSGKMPPTRLPRPAIPHIAVRLP